jgi:hypothetical protein
MMTFRPIQMDGGFAAGASSFSRQGSPRALTSGSIEVMGR